MWTRRLLLAGLTLAAGMVAWAGAGAADSLTAVRLPAGPIRATAALSRTARVFLLLDGIPGESRVSGYANQIEVSAYGWQAEHTYETRAGTLTLSPLVVRYVADRSLPRLQNATETGRVIVRAVLTELNNTGKKLRVIELKEVKVGSVSIAAGAGAYTTMDVSFLYGTITTTSYLYAVNGAAAGWTRSCWSVTTGRAC